jgi:hypothetical protein
MGEYGSFVGEFLVGELFIGEAGEREALRVGGGESWELMAEEGE